MILAATVVVLAALVFIVWLWKRPRRRGAQSYRDQFMMKDKNTPWK